MQPVLVRPRAAGGWELIAGERRWRAAREAGLKTVPAVVRNADDRDSLLLALVENVAREQLTPVEEARAYAVLMDEFVLTLSDVAEKVGRSKPSVANRLRLLDLPDDVLGMVERGRAVGRACPRGSGGSRSGGSAEARRPHRPPRSLGPRCRASCEMGRREAAPAQARPAGRPCARREGAGGGRACARETGEDRPWEDRGRLCRRARAGGDRRGARAGRRRMIAR